MINLILLIVCLMLGIVFVVLMYWKAKNERSDRRKNVTMNFDTLVREVKRQIVELEKEDNFSTASSDEEWEAALESKMRLTKALKECVYGVDSAKIIVLTLIEEIIQELLPDEESLLKCKNFKKHMTSHEKMEFIFAYLKPKYKTKSLEYIIEEFDLNAKRYYIENKEQASYVVDDKDISLVFNKLNIELTYQLMVKVLAVLVYQQYRGFGVIDTLREMDINGLNCGTSGSVLHGLGGPGSNGKHKLLAPRSVWVQYKGTYIHFRFLTFGSVAELQRVTQLICRWGNPGALVAKRGYIIGTMYDKSRVVSVRPPAAECWAFFLRKFSLPNVSLEYLLNPKKKLRDEKGVLLRDEKGNIIEEALYHNVQLIQKTLMYLMLGRISTLFTGRQSSGKTTLMEGAVYYIDPTLNIRTIETIFELYLRELYPERNILSFQETEHISMEQLQDMSKKTDSAVTIVGEIATNSIATRWIQNGQVSSIFTIASHHGVTTEKAVQAIANSVAADTGMPNDTALDQVLDVLKVDIHLDFNSEGMRYVERVTEVIPLRTVAELPKVDESNIALSQVRIFREFARRQTETRSFYTRDVLRFNKNTLTYEACDNFFTPELTSYMLNNMPKERRTDFTKFVESNWLCR